MWTFLQGFEAFLLAIEEEILTESPVGSKAGSRVQFAATLDETLRKFRGKVPEGL